MGVCLVGIGGGSGSGKSTLARAILARRPDSCIVELDWYYRDLARFSLEERARWNFDHPDALDWSLMLDQLGRLSAGDAIAPPVYDFSTHTRSGAFRAVGPAKLVVLEGILALHHEDVRHALDLSIFVDAAETVRLARRLDRDVRERGRTPRSVREQFVATVRPMHEAFVEPTRAWADVVADGETGVEPAAEQALALLGGLAESRSA